MVCNLSILGRILKGTVSVCYFAHGTEKGRGILFRVKYRMLVGGWKKGCLMISNKRNLLRPSMTGQSGLETRDRAEFLVVIARPRIPWARSAIR